MCPNFDCGIPACSPKLELDTNHFYLFLFIDLFISKVGNWHSPTPLRRQTSAAGPSFLAVATATIRPDYQILDIHGSLGCWSAFCRPHSSHPNRAPLKGAPRYEPPPEGRVSFSVRVVKYWKQLSISVKTAPSVIIYKKRLKKVWSRSFNPVSPLTEISASPFPYSPLPNCTPPINSPHL